ncbi:MAG: bacteriocin transporter [Oscillatoriales cyanobacterium]|uniref:redoxin domain-containing protein n=1 Tax=Microcoleus sp. PH2017_05_CCC_O_A TaxID=2798816 RepID=UPI001DEC5613|nr:redoxin domain-containing protein [Microcoleus sp. PH2017_05_CCC_O_A]MCC3434803.1 redoxin domain-containing protein [Microcoleus sp. PH2017_05_CCC_O_A]TAG00876.1 MAG: bacteriocin transporter [Oscillatoriales cyanobacterium]TAG16957.1 MAG: bacteriocin transporter [Oscillatoriales cyanobacterium]TAG43378.1 MAG: bacteriocin transporter [Oscillatoriales cyanobacterium]
MPLLQIGDPAPWFSIASSNNPLFHFSTVGGRRVVLFFFASAAFEQIQVILKSFQELSEEFKTLQVPLLGVSVDAADKEQNRVTLMAPSFIFFWDLDKKVSQQYGVSRDVEENGVAGVQYAPQTFILNENLQVINILPMGEPHQHAQQVLNFLKTLPPKEEGRPATPHAPVLVIPNVLDSSACRSLIDMYKAHGGSPSGFMRQIDEKTVGIHDDTFKKRRDFFIEDPKLQQRLNAIILRRVRPEVEKAFQFTITRFERYLVGCYDAQSGGYFRPHRDNTSKATLHRKFAMTLNLNVGEYTGGFLRFPEYAPHGYKGDSGTAIIFSCSVLHEATPVISGQRFALLSFFYGDEDAKVRQANFKYLADDSDSRIGEPAE